MSVVVLSRGDRPESLIRLIRSVRAQRSLSTHVVLVMNGVGEESEQLDVDVDEIIELPDNVGIPAGRNAGLQRGLGEYVAFFDDDGWLADEHTLGRALRTLKRDPDLAAVSMRIVDESGATARRHIPRLGRRSASRPGEVTAFLGGAVLARSDAIRQVGGYDERFFYAMEETDLAWRLADCGWRMWYEPGSVFVHPATEPSRHPDYLFRTARNRLWAAWKSLPHPVCESYLAIWGLAMCARARSVAPIVRGYRVGWRERPERAPMSWSTVWRLSRLGRPPLV